uniref:Ferritin n=1 Tax=Angiostrongylus cantonensis TaxID=6313 RepID=A0A0K0D435_ANGCA
MFILIVPHVFTVLSEQHAYSVCTTSIYVFLESITQRSRLDDGYKFVREAIEREKNHVISFGVSENIMPDQLAKVETGASDLI